MHYNLICIFLYALLFAQNFILVKSGCYIVRRRFAPRTHRNALRDPHIQMDAKTQFQRNVSQHSFYGNDTGPTRA
jgi:hypothetical protein